MSDTSNAEQLIGVLINKMESMDSNLMLLKAENDALKQVINNLQKHLISRRICLWVFASLAMIFVHGAYDYAIHIPLYTYSIAMLYGLLLTTKHVSSSTKTSLYPLLLPSFAILTCIYIYFNFHNSIPHKANFTFSKNAEIEELSNNISRTPQSWHNWFFLANTVSKLESPHHSEFIERCLNQAAIHNPNNSELWRKLALYRLEMNQRSKSASAYRQFFLLQPKITRFKYEIQTRFILKLNKYFEVVEKCRVTDRFNYLFYNFPQIQLNPSRKESLQ